MKKHLLVIAGVLCVGAVGFLCQADGPATQPATQPAAVDGPQQAGGQQAAGERGKGTLMELPVPAAEAFKADDGRSGWRLKVPGGRPLATPAVVNGTLFLGGGFGSHEFYALEAKTGKRRWTFKCGDDGPTAAVVGEGCVVYNTESCTIYVQEADTGKVLWWKWLGDPLMSQPAIGAGKVYMAYPAQGGHKMAAFELQTGRKVWEQPITAEVITAPVVAGDYLLVATVDGTMYLFDLATGKVQWTKKYDATSAPRVRGKLVFISQRTEKAMEVADEKGKKTSSKITMEGLNVVSIEEGKLANAQPLAAVKAPFLLALAGQRDTYGLNATLATAGQANYAYAINGAMTALRDAGGSADDVKAISSAAKVITASQPANDMTAAAKNAEEARKLAEKMVAAASQPAADAKAKAAQEKVRKLAKEITEAAGKTKDAAEAASGAQALMSVTNAEVAGHAKDDASVGFAAAPGAANLGAAAQLGQDNVKAVWAFQGSRPCLLDGLAIMVHGAKVQAVEIDGGKVAWEYDFKYTEEGTRRPVTPPALAGGKLYLGTAEGLIVCLDGKTGRKLWESKVGGRILFELAVVDGRVYAATADGTIVCLETGDKTADGWHMWGGTAKHNGAEPAGK